MSDWDADTVSRSFTPHLGGGAVPEEVLEAHASSLPAFTPRAFHYFLKDYLLYSLDHLDSEVAEYLIFRLHGLRTDEDYGRERLNLFSPVQKQVVIDCCEAMLNEIPERERHLRQLLKETIGTWQE